MFLINCEINPIFDLVCKLCYSFKLCQSPTFSVTDTKLYVPVATLSTQDNANLLQQLKSKQLTGININQKYEQKDKINI